jgi:hypothetical protein
LNRQPASANLTIFDTPLNPVVGFETECGANGLRQSHAVFPVDGGRLHAEIIPQERPCFKRFLKDYRLMGVGGTFLPNTESVGSVGSCYLLF